METQKIYTILRTLTWVLVIQCVASQCPNNNECRCQPGTNTDLILYCARENLQTVPTFKDTTWIFSEVTLAGNAIKSLPANAFKTPIGQGLNTKILDLSSNPIEQIDALSFAGLGPYLETLKLDVNGMTSFPTAALQQLPNLKQLYLKGFNTAQFPANALAELRGLEILSIQECGLSTLNPADFTSQVNSLREVHLMLNKFTAVPSSALNMLQQMTTLDLSQNQISTIDSNAFAGMNRLETLIFASNGVNTITSNAFSGIEDTLKYLSLKSNVEIVEADLTPVSSLRNLEQLDLSYNKLSRIPNQFFQQMSKLKIFTVNNNEITSINQEAFQDVGGSLETLHLQRNRINSIQTNTFTVFNSLKYLDLSEQNLQSSFHADTFKGLENILETLSLSNTGFSNTYWSSVEKLSNLLMLKLDSNDISSVPSNTFVNMNSLQTLHLQKNSISQLTQESFKGLQFSLQKIYLGSNAISTLDECVFHKFASLTLINLDSNPLHCDCQLVWLHQFLIDNNLKDITFWICTTPSEHSGSIFSQIPQSSLTCVTTPAPKTCADYTITTTQTTLTNEITPPGGSPYPMAINISDITDSTMRVHWMVSGVTNTQGWGVKCTDIVTGVLVYDKTFAAEVRECLIEKLKPSTEYSICVRAILNTGGSNSNSQACSSESTMPTQSGVLTSQDKLQIILGAILAAVFVIIIGIIVFCYIRWRNNRSPPIFKPEEGASNDGSFVPTVGDQSKRFSKPKSASMFNLNTMSTHDLDRRLEGFSQQERDRILHLFSASGASTLSMLSTNSHRYSQEPNGAVGGRPLLPRGRPGYINPAPRHSTTEFLRQDSGPYQEIPADTYDEIPIDKVGEDNGAYNMPDEDAMIRSPKDDDRPRSTGNILEGASNYI